ncbi:uncharacterized protein [Amphiura filiformis]|uniref:uncharacterized protein n=1 Tax=Amphiura filiformis TaxID=82378 RepID=UPI003B217C2B
MKSSLIHMLLVLAVTVATSSINFIYPKGLPCKVYNSTELDCRNRKLTSIPPLEDRNVESLDLSYNQLETVNGESFIFLTSLQRLDLSYNQLENVSGKSFIHLASLQSLDLSHNNISKISNDTFTGLNKLDTLDLSNQNHFNLLGSPFRSTLSLKKLYIAFSGLSSLLSSVFSGLRELQELTLSNNKIPSLPASIFHGLTNLTHLYLSENAISRLPETLFVDLFSLDYLDLSDNDISSLPETLFVNLTHLNYIDLSRNRLTYTPCKAIEGLQTVSILNMGLNEFDYITCSIRNMTSLKEYTASFDMYNSPDDYTGYWNETKWSELITKLPASLSTLRLDVGGDTEFQTVKAESTKSYVSSLMILSALSRGYPQIIIKDDAFSMFPHLHILSIKSLLNSPTILFKYAFRGLSHLKLLDLSINGLTKFPYEALEVLADSLEQLDLSNNNINIIGFKSHNADFRLKSLDVSGNPIFEIHLGSFGNLTHLYLNDRKSLGVVLWILFHTTTTIADFRSISISAETITEIKTDGIPLCSSYPALENITFGKLRFNVDYAFMWGSCSHLKSLVLFDSDGMIFDFEVAVAKFPQLDKLTLTNCFLSSIDQFLLGSHSLQHINMSNNNIEDINGNDFSSLVNLKSMDLSHNAIESLTENQFHHIKNLTYLNLAGNKLANLNSLKGLYGLQTLIVSGNAITTLPAFLMKNPYNLLHVEFGDIPFSCNCDIQPLQHWIMTDTKTYIDPQPPYLCKSPVIRENLGITEISLDCSLHLEFYIAPSVAGLLLICIMVCVIYRYRWHLHYKCWTWCCQRRYQRYIDNDDDADINSDDDEDVDAPYEAPIMRRRYHAYVAYHKDNEAWINDQLIPNIEDGPERFRLCLKDRGDIPAGHYILNAICHGIQQSRKTIAVLSENFMDDGWCHYQLHFARMRMVTDKADVLILVQIGEIPDRKKTLLLRQLLCYKEVLKWPEDLVGQELFWNQLKMKLRKPVRVDHRFDEDR